MASAAYHAFSDRRSSSAPVTAAGAHGGERASRHNSRAYVESEKTTGEPMLPLNGSTDAILSSVDIEDVTQEPRGAVKPVPRTFLGPGYGMNSYFAWRLRISSQLVGIVAVVGIVAFWTTKDIAYGGVNVDDIAYALSFGRTKTDDCIEDTAYCGACDTIVTYSMLAYHVTPLVAMVGLPASGFRCFDPFRRWKPGDERQKLQRSVFFQLCELLSVAVLAFSIIVILYFAFAVVQGNTFTCSQVAPIVYVVMAVLTFVFNFVVLTYFARFREHLKMQLGVYDEADQTGGIRTRLQRRRKYKSERSEVIADVRKHLYRETTLGNVGKLKTLLDQAKRDLGDSFVREMYSDVKLVFKLFGYSKKNPLHEAAFQGNVEALQLLFEAGFDLNSYDKVARVRFTTGDLFWSFAQWFIARPADYDDEMSVSIFHTTLITPLHCAVGAGQVQAVQWLLEHGADVNRKSKATYWSDRMPLLFWANNAEIIRLLLEAGANHLEVADPGYMNTLTVLQMAYLRGNFPVAHELEEWGADVALTPLHEAAANNDTKSIRKLLRAGADPNCLGEYGYVGMNRRTPLHWAAITGAVDAVTLLLEAGSDPNSQDASGRSPLHWAVHAKQLEVVRLLLDKGGDVDLRDAQDHTPLLCAASSKNASIDMFEFLVQRGADIDEHLPNGDTALHIAMKREQKETALALVNAGADIMETNRDGFRPVDCTTSTQLQFEIKQAAGERDVMISYTHSHREFAIKMRESLEAANITCWLDLMDPSGIGGGSVWREEIARGIKNADVVICLYTEDYPSSEWCLKELALAKQVGKPIIAVSTESAPVTEEMQVYIFTRQMVPFEPAITHVDSSNKRSIVYKYDPERFNAQFRLLLDGVRDEIEKGRIDSVALASNRRLANATSKYDITSTDWDPAAMDDVKFAFVCHGDHHHRFVQRLQDRLQDSQVPCFLEGSQVHSDMTERIHAAKEAIVKCSVFIVVLSRKTVNNELVRDQLAFAEDRGRTILPIMLNDMEIPLDKHYTLSRVELLHFTPDLGFNSSFQQLLHRVQDSIPSKSTSVKALRAAKRPNFRTMVQAATTAQPDH